MGKFHDDKLHRLFQCEFRQNVHDFLPLYMRWSDVNDATVITRRHVGGMLKVNKDWVKMRKSEKFLFSERVFWLSKFNTQQLASARTCTTSHCCGAVYIQHVYHCRRNDVTVTSCIDRRDIPSGSLPITFQIQIQITGLAIFPSASKQHAELRG